MAAARLLMIQAIVITESPSKDIEIVAATHTEIQPMLDLSTCKQSNLLS
jgi:hypothetical protein